jgi:DnaJ domain
MSISRRLWRLLKSELNSRFGRFEGSSRKPYEPHHHQNSRASPRDSGLSPEEAKRAQYYRMLELPYGAPLYNVKASYKRLMKKYHPDKFQNEEQRQTATELVKKLNEAYAALEKYLESGEEFEQ